jgi:hypothetical protein
MDTPQPDITPSFITASKQSHLAIGAWREKAAQSSRTTITTTIIYERR